MSLDKGPIITRIIKLVHIIDTYAKRLSAWLNFNDLKYMDVQYKYVVIFLPGSLLRSLIAH